MPVEIFELVVKARVIDANDSGPDSETEDQNNKADQISSLDIATQILDTIKRKKER